jgi:RNA polymerase sigma-70 factor, ECF subfamily
MIASQKNPASTAPLAQIYHDHHDRVFRAAYRIVGNANDAEDVVQTVFLRLAGREGVAHGIDELQSYLYRAAINTGLDLLRARRKGQTVALDEVEQHLGDDSPALADEHRLRACLRRALAELSPRWAEMFVLKHLEGRDNQEIAELCGTSQAVVGVTLFRARSRVKKALTAQSGGAL